jgi:hypothetical protein
MAPLGGWLARLMVIVDMAANVSNKSPTRMS